MYLRPYQKLHRHWRTTEARVVTAEQSEAQVSAIEERSGFQLPKDFREYLIRGSPTTDDNIDADNTTWWTLAWIKNIPEEYKHEISDPEIAASAGTYLFFADYSIWCWAWAIACGDDENHGRIALIGGLPDRFVAESFDEFVSLYVKDFRKVC